MVEFIIDYLNFIQEMYNSMNLTRAQKRIFIHVTTATDVDNVQKVEYIFEIVFLSGCVI